MRPPPAPGLATTTVTDAGQRRPPPVGRATRRACGDEQFCGGPLSIGHVVARRDCQGHVDRAAAGGTARDGSAHPFRQVPVGRVRRDQRQLPIVEVFARQGRPVVFSLLKHGSTLPFGTPEDPTPIGRPPESPDTPRLSQDSLLPPPADPQPQVDDLALRLAKTLPQHVRLLPVRTEPLLEVPPGTCPLSPCLIDALETLLTMDGSNPKSAAIEACDSLPRLNRIQTSRFRSVSPPSTTSKASVIGSMKYSIYSVKITDSAGSSWTASPASAADRLAALVSSPSANLRDIISTHKFPDP